MVIDSDNVHLLKPLSYHHHTHGDCDVCGFAEGKNIVEIDYFYAKQGRIDEMVEFFNERYVPFLLSRGIEAATFRTSELAENDFPQLPVFRNENLVIGIAAFEDEHDYRSKISELLHSGDELFDELENLTAVRRQLVVHPTEKTFAGAGAVN